MIKILSNYAAKILNYLVNIRTNAKTAELLFKLGYFAFVVLQGNDVIIMAIFSANNIGKWANG
jgi:hypothetical protein